jgi:putative transposase
MPSYSSPRGCLQCEQALAPFLADEGLPFASVLPAETIEQACADEGVDFGASKNSVFTPALTLWAFLSQVVYEAKSCHAAVLRVATLLIALERTPCSEDTAAYCRARAKLPACVLHRLALDVGRNLERQVPADWLWQGKHVPLVDGTTVTLPDTPENQQAYPQPASQQPGLGFPMVRLVVLLSLATAALLGMAKGPYQGKETGETALLRQLLAEVPAGDILLADRYYCTYWLVALARAGGLDVVFRLHHLRVYDFRRGRRLGKDDHVVTWPKPQRPDWMDAATYAAIPEQLTVREIRFQVRTPGCRVEELVIATTLTDAAL